MRALNVLRPWWRAHHTPSGGGSRERWQRNRQLVLDHFGVIAGVLLLFCAVIWAAGEHARQRSELRAAETERHITAFHSTPVGDAWRQLTGVWQAERARQSVLLDRIAPLSGPELQAALRNYRAFVIDTVEENELEDEIDTVVQFYARLATCVRTGNCDSERAGLLFGGAAWSFRNQHYYYLLQDARVGEVDRIINAIAPRATPPAPGPRP